MNHSWTQLREVVASVHMLKVDEFCITKANIRDDKNFVKCRCSLDGHDWEIRFHPALCVFHDSKYCLGLDLVFLDESPRTSVTAILSGKIIAQSSGAGIDAFKERKTLPRAFSRPLERSNPISIGMGRARDDFRSCSLTVECSITVFGAREPEGAIPVAPPDLSQHLGELLRQVLRGAQGCATSCVVPRFHGGVLWGDEGEGQAADMYVLDRLKAMCERRLALGVDVSTVALTLALAEQHNCPRLKAKCIEFIAEGSSENLDAVLATEGYKYLLESSPSVLAELLKAGHGKKRGRSPDSNN